MKIYYRISGENLGIKHPPKDYCLSNFLKYHEKYDIVVIADNCSEELLNKISDFKISDLVKTNLGNSGSFVFTLNSALSGNNEEIYFAEDDYLYNCDIIPFLKEGLQLGDYCTCYDHPDKYSSLYNFGELSIVQRTSNHHWKQSISTTMTFAAKKKTLLEDKDVWLQICSCGPIPLDHYAFSFLNNYRNRKLLVSIPGNAYHMDFVSIFEGKWIVDYWVKKEHKSIFPDWFSEKYTLGL